MMMLAETSPPQFAPRRDYPSPNVFAVVLLEVEVEPVVLIGAMDDNLTESLTSWPLT